MYRIALPPLVKKFRIYKRNRMGKDEIDTCRIFLHNKSGNEPQEAQKGTQKGTSNIFLCLLSFPLCFLCTVPAFVVQSRVLLIERARDFSCRLITAIRRKHLFDSPASVDK